MVVVGKSTGLILAGRSIPVGTTFTVSYQQKEYPLELVAVDRSGFTLRFRGEEATEPLRAGGQVRAASAGSSRAVKHMTYLAAADLLTLASLIRAVATGLCRNCG